MTHIKCLLLLAFAIFGVSCQTVPSAPPKQMQIRTTAYTHTEADHVSYGKQTASGTKLKNAREYTSAACDWSFLPVGTVFTIKGHPSKYVIDDYGSALVGTQTIDIYCPSKYEMNRWGVKIVDIDIVNVGDYQKSLAILRPRTKYPHVRNMVSQLEKEHEVRSL